MSKHLELLRQRGSVLDVAEAMVASAVSENRGLTDDEQRQVEGYKEQAAKLEQQAKLVEELGNMRSTSCVTQAPLVNLKT